MLSGLGEGSPSRRPVAASPLLLPAGRDTSKNMTLGNELKRGSTRLQGKRQVLPLHSCHVRAAYMSITREPFLRSRAFLAHATHATDRIANVRAPYTYHARLHLDPGLQRHPRTHLLPHCSGGCLPRTSRGPTCWVSAPASVPHGCENNHDRCSAAGQPQRQIPTPEWWAGHARSLQGTQGCPDKKARQHVLHSRIH